MVLQQIHIKFINSHKIYRRLHPRTSLRWPLFSLIDKSFCLLPRQPATAELKAATARACLFAWPGTETETASSLTTATPKHREHVVSARASRRIFTRIFLHFC